MAKWKRRKWKGRLKVYYNLSDIAALYSKLNGYSNYGRNAFLNKARPLAVMEAGEYQFKNEEALFRLFQEEMPDKLTRWKISCWGELVQFM